MAILGISAYFHDSAASLISDNGAILAAAQEERFTRTKHDASFPNNAIRFCFERARQAGETIDQVVFYERPDLKFERVVRGFAGRTNQFQHRVSQALSEWANEKLNLDEAIAREMNEIAPSVDWREKLVFVEHHASHAASAFYPSPFSEAAILVVDGVGEFASTSIATGNGNRLTAKKQICFPHSLGLLYSAFTYYTGFKVNSGEYKLMGLAPYGDPTYASLIRDRLIELREDGSYQINADYFDGFVGAEPINQEFIQLFEAPRRDPEAPITHFHANIAASIQSVIEDAILGLARAARAVSDSSNLCLAGGVALNCVANGKLLKELPNLKLWTQPAAGDAGGSLGSALYQYYHIRKNSRTTNAVSDSMQSALLGPHYEYSEISDTLSSIGAAFDQMEFDDLIQTSAQLLADGNSIGWFQGQMEFGPRALGGRSILADPRSPSAQQDLNLKIKKRESFRPFAPAILEEQLTDWFELDQPSPYMLATTSLLQKRRKPEAQKEASKSTLKIRTNHSEIPATTHVDYSARVQTVGKNGSKFRTLLEEFFRLTHCPILLNTSFNIRGEPIVCTPEDAFACFMNSGIDYLVIGNCLLAKTKQDYILKLRYSRDFAPD